MQILPNAKSQFIDQNGLPLASGTVGFYFPGTLNPKPTYQDAAGTIANTNPVTLDSRGQALIWGSGVYRQIVKDASGVTIWDQVTEDSNSGLIGNMTDDVFVAGTDFTPGTTTQLTLTVNPGSIANTWIFFDATYQDDPQISSLNGTTLIFTSPIPVGVSKVTVKIGSTIPIGTPNDGTVTDSTVAANAGIQSSKLSFLQSVTGAVKRTVQDKLTEEVSIFDFMTAAQVADYRAGTALVDQSAPLAAAASWLAASSSKRKLIFPAGVCSYSASPNWAIQNAVIEGQGEVHLRYTGTGQAVVIDGSSAPNLGVYNMTMANFTVENTAGTDGVFVKQCHHSRFKFKVRAAGATSAGIKTYFCVASHFDNCEVSPNADGGWYGGVKPLYGFYITGAPTQQTSYCTFTNPIAETLNATNGAGIFIECSLGNSFYTGTSEGCYTGVLTASSVSGCVSNKFFGVDLEGNTQQDIYEQGQWNEYHSCDTNLLVNVIGVAVRPEFFGGTHQSISIASGVSYAGFFGVAWNRNGGGTFAIGDNSVRIRDCFDHTNNKPGPFPQTGVAVGASPFTYTNTYGRDVVLALSSGTISQIQLIRGGTGTLIAPTTGFFPLSPGDQLQITYSVVPNIWLFTK